MDIILSVDTMSKVKQHIGLILDEKLIRRRVRIIQRADFRRLVSRSPKVVEVGRRPVLCLVSVAPSDTSPPILRYPQGVHKLLCNLVVGLAGIPVPDHRRYGHRTWFVDQLSGSVSTSVDMYPVHRPLKLQLDTRQTPTLQRLYPRPHVVRWIVPRPPRLHDQLIVRHHQRIPIQSRAALIHDRHAVDAKGLRRRTGRDGRRRSAIQTHELERVETDVSPRISRIAGHIVQYHLAAPPGRQTV